MSPADLAQEIDIEFDAIRRSIDELESLRRDIGEHEPQLREIAAAGLFLANFYSGVENVLKRICRFNSVDIPGGRDWHVELVTSFCDPPRAGLPVLLEAALNYELAPYRHFRHVLHHGYGFRLRWQDMLPGIEGASQVFDRFRLAVDRYVRQL